jgi:hypothetical protein
MRQPRYSYFMKAVLPILAILAIQTPRTIAQVPTAQAQAAGERIRLDGKFDEASWKMARAIGDLAQVLPKEGEAASEKTDVRVLVNSEAIYFGITCFDRTPSAIVSTQLTRDAILDVDDNITIVLDPFFDQRNGFFFSVNPAGARADGQISNNSGDPTLDWDGIWNASARITPQGWVTEIAIPFKTLRFKPGQARWGLNIQRVIKRRNETDRWAGLRRDVWLTNLAEAGYLENLPNVRQGKGLDIRPYGVVRRDTNLEHDWKLDGGFDVSKNLAPNLNASLTVNTDFAETEVDARQINLTRFDLFFPEKRPFFLEGAGVFETASNPGSLGGAGPPPDLIPFFTRRIGLNATREATIEVPIIAGGKITGRQSRYNIGFLDVQTDKVEDAGLSSQNLLAARISRDFWRQSYVGAIFTRGNPTGEGDNSLIGADARIATSTFRGDKNLALNLFLFRTSDEASNSSDYAGGLKVDYPNDRWFASAEWKQIGEKFQPALGFAPRTGMRKTGGVIMFRPRPEKWGIRQATFLFSPELITDLNNRVDNWELRINPIELEFDSGDTLEVSYAPSFERLPEPFEISKGIIVPAGSYNFTRYEFEAATASKRPWVVSFSGALGSFYNGTRRDLGLELTLKPSDHFLFGLRAERNDVSLEQGDFFTQLFSLQADYNFSPNVSWANLVQYDNESRILGFQSRFRWILKPGNDLFLVMNRGWFRTFDHEYISSFDKGTIKLQYTFRY